MAARAGGDRTKENGVILADAVTVPSGGDWRGFAVVCVFGLFALEKLIAVFGWGMRLVRPEKREVSMAEEYASKTDFLDLKQQVEKHEVYGAERRKAIYSMMDKNAKHTDEKIDAFRKEVKEDINGVHDRVTELGDRISGLAGEIKHALNG